MLSDFIDLMKILFAKILSHFKRKLILMLNILFYAEIKYINQFHKWTKLKSIFWAIYINEDILKLFQYDEL
jgi:hypothetical protein